MVGKKGFKQRVADFSGEMFFLSNFYQSRIFIDGREFSSVEQYYQWRKCSNEEDRKAIMSANTPGETKRIGKRVKLIPHWEEIKLEVMYKGVRAKFTQNKQLAQRLISTVDSKLVEGNNWGDTFWGVDYYTRAGNNHLGKILMRVKGEILQELME